MNFSVNVKLGINFQNHVWRLVGELEQKLLVFYFRFIEKYFGLSILQSNNYIVQLVFYLTDVLFSSYKQSDPV